MRKLSRTLPAALPLLLIAAAACSSTTTVVESTPNVQAPEVAPLSAVTPPSPDPRVGLGAGLFDAEQAIWNLRLVSTTPSPAPFEGVTNSDLSFLGNYALQGNYNGFMVWDISRPASPTLVRGFFCPASQSDVSVYRNLLFVSGEGMGGRLDCGGQGVEEAVSHDRLRGIRIFDISDIQNPVNVGNVQTCRGSHTHSVLVDPEDAENVYIYVSGSSRVRDPEELPGCSGASPEEDPNSALFRIEVIRVPLADPGSAAIVSSPRIFEGLEAPPEHGEAPAEREIREAAVAAARARGDFVARINGVEQTLSSRTTQPLLDSIVAARGGEGAGTAADSAALREGIQAIIDRMFGTPQEETGPTQCHDITLYPAIDRAGGACGGYGLLLDISDPTHPRRLAAVADSNFSYWHSATFNNDGSKLLFSDEWGGGGGPKCRDSDPREWGADAIFTVEGDELTFHEYYKLSAPQTPQENCVAHNGSLIPVPGRDVMVQGWYQGGISVFDWTDPGNPVEIAYHDRGPVNAERMAGGGSWSVYWYNGLIVSSEIARGLDIFELTPSPWMTQNEIDAAKSVRLDYLNVQGQPQFEWPATFALAKAYLDQLARDGGLTAARVAAARSALASAEAAGGGARRSALTGLAAQLRQDAAAARDAAKVRTLADAVERLAAG
jgi:hypothetical protein